MFFPSTEQECVVFMDRIIVRATKSLCSAATGNCHTSLIHLHYHLLVMASRHFRTGRSNTLRQI